MKNYIKQVALGVDQLANTLLGGYADETLSSRMFRLYRDTKYKICKVPCILIDTLFFFDYTMNMGCKLKHCQLSYISELERAQLPPEFRK